MTAIALEKVRVIVRGLLPHAEGEALIRELADEFGGEWCTNCSGLSESTDYGHKMWCPCCGGVER